MKATLPIVADLLAAGLSLTGTGLILAAAYVWGGGIADTLRSALAGAVLLAVGMTYLVRRDSTVSNKLVGALKTLFNAA